MFKLASVFAVVAMLPSVALASPLPPAIPEAGVLPLFGIGLVAAVIARRRMK